MTNSHSFLNSDWSSSFNPFVDKPLIGLSWCGGSTHYRPLQPDNFLVTLCLFLAYDWSSCFCAFVDKLLIGLSSNFVGEFIVRLHWYPAASWPLIGWAVSGHVRINHWLNLSQICWVNSPWDSLGLIFLGHALLNCHPFRYLIFDWWNYFHTFADKRMIRMNSNKLGELMLDWLIFSNTTEFHPRFAPRPKHSLTHTYQGTCVCEIIFTSDKWQVFYTFIKKWCNMTYHVVRHISSILDDIIRAWFVCWIVICNLFEGFHL